MEQLPEPTTGEALPQLFTAREVADAVKVQESTVITWARSGKIESVTLPSGHRRFKREVIDAILSGDYVSGAA